MYIIIGSRTRLTSRLPEDPTSLVPNRRTEEPVVPESPTPKVEPLMMMNTKLLMGVSTRNHQG